MVLALAHGPLGEWNEGETVAPSKRDLAMSGQKRAADRSPATSSKKGNITVTTLNE